MKFPEKCFILKSELVDEFTEIVPLQPIIGHHQGYYKCKERLFKIILFKLQTTLYKNLVGLIYDFNDIKQIQNKTI